MKILFLTHFFIPEIGAASKRMYGLSSNLKKLGHDVQVITGFPSYPTGIKPSNYKRKIYVKEEFDGITIHRFYTYASSKKNSLVRILNYLSLTISSMLFIFKRERGFDYIVFSSPPILLGISALAISFFKRIPLVYDIRDIWPDIALEIGEMSEKSPMYKILNVLANILYKKSDLITVVTKGKEIKLKEKGIDINKVKLVSNGFDKEFIENSICFETVAKYRLNEGNIILYTGVIGLAQGLDLIIDTAKKMKNIKNIRFILVGDGFEKQNLESKAKSLGLSNIEFIGVQPHSKIYTFLKYSLASVVTLKNKNLKDSVPTKMLESMGVQCPVILNAYGDSVDIINSSKAGVVTKLNDSESIKDAILYLINNPGIRDQMKINGQKYVLKYFSRDIIAKQFSYILEQG